MRSHAKAVVAVLATLLLTLALAANPASAEAPTVTIDPPSDVAYTTVSVSGTVDPKDVGTWWSYETSTDGGASWSGFDYQGYAEENTGSQGVPLELTGLAPGTGYEVRLVAMNSVDPEVISAVETFTTLPVAKPLVTFDPVSSVTGDSAHFEGTVNPNAPEPNEDLDEKAKGAFETTYRFECEPACPGTPEAQTIAADDQSQTMSFDPEGLEPDTAYEVRLIASNAGGEEIQTRSFTTDAIGPDLATAGANSPTDSAARLSGFVDPNNNPATYYFEWGTAPDLADAQRLDPPSDEDTVEGNAWQAVGVALANLAPATRYYFRLVASNGVGGEARGEIHGFTTYPTPVPDPPYEGPPIPGRGFLPDNRGWELVNDPDLGGTYVSSGRLSTDSNRVIYNSFGPAPGGQAGELNIFLSDRGPAGWPARNIEPTRVGGNYRKVYPDALSPDLSRLINRGGGLDGSGAVAIDLVRVDTASPNSLELLFSDQRVMAIGAAASDDLEVYFKIADFSLLPGDPERSLYELGSGSPVLASVLPNGDPACGPVVMHDQGVIVPLRQTSLDGSRVFFRAGDCEGATGLFMRAAGSGRDYSSSLATTVRLDEPAAGQPEVGEPTFVQATPDGSKAFFLTAANLPGDDNDSTDLYRYDVSTGTRTCLTCVAPQPAGISQAFVAEDGSRAYVISDRVLAAGASAGARNIYLVVDGGLRFVAVGNTRSDPGGSRTYYLTPDGGSILFSGHVPQLNTLTGADNGGLSQAYRYDAVRDQLDCLSCPRTGAASSVGLAGTHGFTDADFQRVISDDGRIVPFTTDEALVPADVNGRTDVYRWRAGQGVALITEGSNPNASSSNTTFHQISADGSTILFGAAARLTPEVLSDRTPMQLYVARVGGGFPPTPTPAPCQGDVCHGAPSAPPGVEASGTSLFAGPGNPVAKKSCGKGKARKNDRCVKKRKKRASGKSKSKRAGRERAGRR